MDYIIYNIPELPSGVADSVQLPPEERENAARRGGQYALVRTILRRELERRTGVPAGDIVLSYSEHGKPLCENQPFNLSHSGDCLCLAFHHSDIGVDVERERPRNFAALAARFMCPGQYAAFESRGFPQEEFYSCWCAAEALVKLAGDTMWHAHDYPFLYEHGKIKCLFSPSPEVLLFIPMEGYRGAVAYR